MDVYVTAHVTVDVERFAALLPVLPLVGRRLLAKPSMSALDCARMNARPPVVVQIHWMRRLSTALVLIASMLADCGGGGKGTFVYRDLQCSGPLPDGSIPTCHEVGDGDSYFVCATDRDCPRQDPYCRTLGLFKGGDYSCNGFVLICRAVNHDDCAR